MCLVLTGFLLFFVVRQLQGASGKAMSFGKSRARMMDEKDKKITFEDVAGAEEAKEDLVEIVDFLKDTQENFQRLGGRIPKGVLMVGPPGTGKTAGQSCCRRSRSTFLFHQWIRFCKMFCWGGCIQGS